MLVVCAFDAAMQKVVDYLLNPGHRSGAGQARFVGVFGFRREHGEVLRGCLVRTWPPVRGYGPFGEFNAVFGSGSVPGEDEITRFDRHVAGMTAAKSHRVDRFTVVELRVTPASGRGVFRRIFNHELNVCGIPCHE